ncbi:glucose-6-phosphate isomerase [Aeromonas veronii]|uniref:glucose-6-phosphate isomerase family protein n=1 Tax=Aeromonas veronii TaxID=654 RepID=UPI001116BE21|nr:glucose-6-phosphate isomerase family protein [Aeromonas veronii]TNJ05112.1 glucose-6-phosphate isomerase [Aeromonas veronii]
MTPMIPPILDFATGKLGGAELVEKSTTLADLQGLFADPHAEAALSPDTRLYRVAMLPGNGGEGDLNMGVTYLEAGRVGQEFFMTRGHIHARAEQAEYYFGLCGRGLLLLQDMAGVCRLEQVFAGSVHHIPGHVAHRLVNTGETQLSALAVWPAIAGHDYRLMAEREFGLRVVAGKEGEPCVVISEVSVSIT